MKLPVIARCVLFFLFLCKECEVLGIDFDGDCPDQPSEFSPCIRINHWDDFLETVKGATSGSLLILCPFIIKKQKTENPAIIENSIRLVCRSFNHCIIKGGGSHLIIRGGDTSSLVQGITFEGATKTALRIESSAIQTQMICNCKFYRNFVLGERGASLKAEMKTTVSVGFCIFEKNISRQGSGVYNRGKMELFHSIFNKNIASEMGAAVKNSKTGDIDVTYCEFNENRAKIGPVMAVVGIRSYSYDGGGNKAWRNIGSCPHGHVTTDNTLCIDFDQRTPPLDFEFPTKDVKVANGGGEGLPENIDKVMGPMPRGYFNANESDKQFGPMNWKNVDTTGNQWGKFRGLISSNQCHKRTRQSPINFIEPNRECEATHQIRTHPGNTVMSSNDILFSITPTRLKIEFDQHYEEAPSADLPNGFIRFPAKFIEIAMPSLHSLGGKQYDAEYTIFHVDNRHNLVIALSVFISAASSNVENSMFQELLLEWDKVESCSVPFNGKLPINHNEEYSSKNKKIFDIYHKDLVPTAYFHAYRGSLTEPPCLNTQWRVMTKPMKINKTQLSKINTYLTNGPCKDNVFSHGLEGKLTRPMQPMYGRSYWNCSRKDFPLDCERNLSCKCNKGICPADLE